MNNPFVVRFEVAGRQHGTAFIAADDTVWIAVQPRWHDLATWLWWWLCPSDRRAKMVITRDDHVKVKTRAVRVADRFVRISGTPRSL